MKGTEEQLSQEEMTRFGIEYEEMKALLKSKSKYIKSLLLFATECTPDELEEIENYYILKSILPSYKDLATKGKVIKLDRDMIDARL